MPMMKCSRFFFFFFFLIRRRNFTLNIPPNALKLLLESFEGPLDLLLFLIRKQKFDIMDIPMALLTEQYMAYVEGIKDTDFELAADYLVMAASL